MDIPLPDLATTEALAAKCARAARTGDCFALSGELGAGKTAFARAFIRTLAGADTEVPSPTYTLVQTYDAPGLAITHADLYRIKSADELDELGLADAIASGITLIEWPEIADTLLPAQRIALTFAHAGEGRILRCNAPEEWYSRLTFITSNA